MRGRQGFCIRLGRSCLIAELNQKKETFLDPAVVLSLKVSKSLWQNMSEKKRILVLGSGMVAPPCIEYLTRNPQNGLAVGKTISIFPS
jgi:hypothetical protein